MKGRAFIDTNVLVYADDADAGEKTEIARTLVKETLLSGKGLISTQVLQEYFVIATRKLGIAADAAQRRVEVFAQTSVLQIDSDRIMSAIKLHRLRSISFWDALIVRAAADGRCSTIYTEDMQNDEIIDNVRITNPFTENR